MKYLAFRVDTTSIKNNKVVKGFFVRGQRPTDYNWPLLGEFPNIDAAKDYIRSLITDPVRQIVYDNSGYEMKL